MRQKRKYDKNPRRPIHSVHIFKTIRLELMCEDNDSECCVYFSMLRTRGKQKGEYTARLRDYWYPYTTDEDAIRHFKKYVDSRKSNYERYLAKKPKAKSV